MELVKQLRRFVPKFMSPVIVINMWQESMFMPIKEWMDLGKGIKEEYRKHIDINYYHYLKNILCILSDDQSCI